MLVYPFDFKRVSSLIYITLPPYLYLICRDLKYTGYQATRYPAGLCAVPGPAAGRAERREELARSSSSSASKRSSDARPRSNTGPRSRWPARPRSWLCSAGRVMIFHADVPRGDELHAVFALSNALALGYGIVAMIGLREIAYDYAHAAANLAVGIWRKVFPGRTTPLPEPVMLPSGLQLIAAEHAPPLQAAATQEAIVTAIQRHADRLREGPRSERRNCRTFRAHHCSRPTRRSRPRTARARSRQPATHRNQP